MFSLHLSMSLVASLYPFSLLRRPHHPSRPVPSNRCVRNESFASSNRKSMALQIQNGTGYGRRGTAEGGGAGLKTDPTERAHSKETHLL